MPRKIRQLQDGGIYHVFNRGNDRKDLFQEPEDYDYFIERLTQEKTLLSVQLFHYCLMSNHFHLLLQVQHGTDLSKLMHKVQLAYARYFKAKYEFIGHVFQERFRSPRIPSESYYLQCGRYIERNPVKAEMVTKAEEYPYSSAAHYTKGMPNLLITPNVYYVDMGRDDRQRQENYRKFLLIDEPYESILAEALLRA